MENTNQIVKIQLYFANIFHCDMNPLSANICHIIMQLHYVNSEKKQIAETEKYYCQWKHTSHLDTKEEAVRAIKILSL